jgi:MoxR-like ATPase
MWDSLYRGRPSAQKPERPVLLPAIDVEKAIVPSGYLPDSGLTDAVNVSLMLRQPLLLTGEPGTGKTQLGFSIAWELGLDTPLLFETKSTSVSRDLFYTFDNVRRFQAAYSTKEDLDPRQFITYNALGLAILRTHDREFSERFASSFQLDYDGPRRSLVVIDEIDKAPRDFPNDILNEIEHLYFRIPELGAQLSVNQALRPIVVITSNSEKSLPDAFLRRCIFYNIPFPDDVRLEEIVLSRIPSIAGPPGGALNEVLDFFERLRATETGLRKKPGTAELLAWVTVLGALGIDPNRGLRSQAEAAIRSLSALAKHSEDQERAIEAFKAWVHET